MSALANVYEQAAETLLRQHRITVRKYRTTTTGIAHIKAREITTPHPRGPISFGTLAHEVGHVILHHENGNYPRWREETEAWEYALQQAVRFELPGYEKIEADAARCLRYSYGKAIRRGVDPNVIRDAYPTWWKLGNCDGIWLRESKGSNTIRHARDYLIG